MLFGSSEAEHEEHLLRGLGASGGVYEGPARRVSGPAEFDRIQQGDVLVTEATTEAFNILLPAPRRDRHRQRWPALALGDRRPRVRHPRRGRHARRDRAHPRRHARAGRRRRGRSHGPRVNGVVPLAEAHDEALFGAKAVGLGDAARAGLPVPPGIALSGEVVDEVAAGNEDTIEAVLAAARPLARTAGRPVVGRRRGRRRRQLRRAAPHAAQRAVDRRPRRRDPSDLVVGELRLRDHVPQARRPLHAPEHRGRRACSCSTPRSPG